MKKSLVLLLPWRLSRLAHPTLQLWRTAAMETCNARPPATEIDIKTVAKREAKRQQGIDACFAGGDGFNVEILRGNCSRI